MQLGLPCRGAVRVRAWRGCGAGMFFHKGEGSCGTMILNAKSPQVKRRRHCRREPGGEAP